MTKSPEEVELLAESGRRLASVFTHLDTIPLAGMSTMQVNDLVERVIVDELSARLIDFIERAVAPRDVAR